MTLIEFQQWLNARGANPKLVEDGKPGPASRAAIPQVFSSRGAAAVTQADIAIYAQRLGGTSQQVRAVASVESSGGGFDDQGRPKILFERHRFWKLTSGRYGITSFSNPQRGGYSESSWDKLANAAMLDPLSAFASCSWGKFQVMGQWWHELGFASPLELAYSCVQSEAAHYDLLVGYIKHFNLEAAFRKLSTNPKDCEAFASGYNGTGAIADYSRKLAGAMQ